ncbi:hypothetical protein [Tropicimonas sp. S265A]|uniref:hypothetical protein n=1 Tax=Tropicimonas sp. S265A TaxID=3415134 RepID=UPI003C7C8327
MGEPQKSWMAGAGDRARGVAFALLTGVARLAGRDEFEKALAAKPQQAQHLITAATLVGLFFCSLLAAQFGWLGMLVFFLAIVLLIN